MAIITNVYTRAGLQAFRGNITDLVDGGTSIKVALLDDTYTFDQNAHEDWTDVELAEIDPANNAPYAAGGKEISNHTFTLDGNLVVFDGDNVSWPDASISANYAVIYDDTPAEDADKKLLCLIDFGGEKSTSDGTFEIQWAANGIFAIEAVAI